MDFREFPRWMQIWFVLAAIVVLVLLVLCVTSGILANSGSGE